MNRLPLNALWPRQHPVTWGLGALAVILIMLSAVGSGHLLMFANTVCWLVFGTILGWHLKTLQQWPAAPLIPRFLLTHVLGHSLLLVGLWIGWWLLVRPAPPAPALALIAAAVGLCWPFTSSVIGLGGSALVLGASFSTTLQVWFASPSAWSGIVAVLSLGLMTILMRGSRAQQPATPKPLRWFWLGVLFDLDKPPKPVAESLARAMRVGAGKSWALAGIILAVTTLISLVTFYRPETRPSLLAMLFPAWMAGFLTMPPLVHLNSMRSLDRLWLTGAFKTRRSFAQAIVAANIKHVRRMNTTALLLLIGVIFVEEDVGYDGMSLVFLLFGASVGLLALTVWTTQAYAKRLRIAVAIAIATIAALLGSYTVLVNDLLFDEPMTQFIVCAGISVAAQFLGVRWAGHLLSKQAASVVSVPRVHRILSS